MKLYDLAQGYVKVLSRMEETEDPTEWQDMLDQIGEGLATKAESVCKLIRTLEADAKAAKDEAKRLADMARARENNAAGLKEYLKRCMEEAKLVEIKGSLFKPKIQKSPPACKVLDEEAVPVEWKRHIPESWRVDAAAILDWWRESGTVVPGVEISQGTHLRIY